MIQSMALQKSAGARTQSHARSGPEAGREELAEANLQIFLRIEVLDEV